MVHKPQEILHLPLDRIILIFASLIKDLQKWNYHLAKVFRNGEQMREGGTRFDMYVQGDSPLPDQLFEYISKAEKPLYCLTLISFGPQSVT